MARELVNLRGILKKFHVKAEETADRERKLFVVRVARESARLIPKRTRHAMDNIVVSRRQPDRTEKFTNAPLKPGATVPTVRAIAERARRKIATSSFKEDIYINYNAPYTSYINDGVKSLSGLRFIQRAIAAAKEKST